MLPWYYPRTWRHCAFIYDAIGVRMTELPITPRKILEALEGQRGGKK